MYENIEPIKAGYVTVIAILNKLPTLVTPRRGA